MKENKNGNGYSGDRSNFFKPNGRHTRGNTRGDGHDNFMDLQYVTHLLWDHKWVIAGTMLLGLILAGLTAYLKTPIYQSSGSLMITESKNQYSYAGSDLGNLLTNSYGIGLGSSIVNELQILRSRSLSREVADTLIDKRFMKNGKQFPILFASYPEDSTIVERDVVAARLRNNLTFVQEDKQSNLINIEYESPSAVEAAQIVNLTITMYSEVSTRQNRRSANAAVAFLENERDRIEDELRTAELQLQQYMDENEIVQVDAQTQSMIQRLTELEQRRQEARTRLVTVNSTIEQYQEQLNNIKPGLADQYANAVGANIQRLQYQLAELKTERTQILSENPNLRNNESPPARLRNLNRQIADFEQEIRDLTNKMIDNSEQYLGIVSGSGEDAVQNMSELNQKIIGLKIEQQQYQAQEEVLSEQISQINQKFEELPENMTSLARLKRTVNINEQLYVTVSEQYAEMSLWKQTQFGQGQLVDEGFVPGSPVEPNTRFYLLVGLMLGTIAGIGFIFIRETFNDTIDGAQKLKEFGMPLLSVIPDLQKYGDKEQNRQEKTLVEGKQVSPHLVSVLSSISPATESFRRLESNILHSSPDSPLKSLMITSTTKGEGKTIMAANLGVVMAEADKKIIVVDTDLRRPNLHNIFGLERSPGINDVLFEDTILKEAIKPTIISNLDILCAGKRPPNPSAITKSDSFLALIERLEQQYDRVIIDTPPFGIITDSSSLIDQTDGVVVVTRFGETKIGEFNHTLSQLERVDANVLGSVLNGFDMEQSSDYYYGQNYYKEFYTDYTTYEREEESNRSFFS